MEWSEVRIRVPAKPFLDLLEVSEVARVHPKTVRRWVREGKFPAPRQPGRWSAVSVGVWLAWQEYAVDHGEGVMDENPPPPQPPVKGKLRNPEGA